MASKSIDWNRVLIEALVAVATVVVAAATRTGFQKKS